MYRNVLDVRDIHGRPGQPYADRSSLAFDLEGLRMLFEPHSSQVDESLELRHIIMDRIQAPAFASQRPLAVVDDNRLPPIRAGSKRTADDAGLTR